MTTITIIKQFIFRLILTGLGQYAVIEGIRVIDPSNSIIELIPMIPFTAIFSTLINTALFHFIVYAVNRLTRFSHKMLVTLSIILGLLLLSIVLFIVVPLIAGILVFVFPAHPAIAPSCCDSYTSRYISLFCSISS